jgi:peptidoglycan/LPS O-acetylase OafA/YrhL
MAAIAAVVFLSVVAALVLTRLGPVPSADVARGSEEAFGRGLHRRELPPGIGPQRWTTARAAFTFRDLPRTGATLVVEIRDARAPVTVAADGVILGRLESGVRAASFPLAATGRRGREVELWSEPFRAGDGRLLGALLGRVAIVSAERDSWPPPAILLELLLPALLAFAVARFAGLRTEWAALTALVTVAFVASALWPSGLAHSPYGPRLCALLCAGSVLALAFALLVARRHRRPRRPP